MAFGSLGLLVMILALATILEKVNGTDFVTTNIYSSVWFVVLWSLLLISGYGYMLKSSSGKRIPVVLLHGSFGIILIGAFITWLFAEQGTVHLRKGEQASGFVTKNSEYRLFPFQMELNGFHIQYYEGTDTPMDFVSDVIFHDEAQENTEHQEIAMNKIGAYAGYRFYQAGYDEDGNGARLSVSYDPFGMLITYAGYVLLLISMLLFFFDKRSYFRQMLGHPLFKRTVMPCVLLFALVPALSANVPKTIPRQLASQMGDLCVLYNGRICPLQTMAKDFTVKLYGKASFEGYDAERVFTGWMFYSTDWEQVPMIKIKSGYVRKLLGIQGRYASLKDFMDRENAYKLSHVKRAIAAGQSVPDQRGVMEADEKFNIIRSFYSGHMFKFFPVRASGHGRLQWYAPSDRLPEGVDDQKWMFVRKSLDYLFEMIVTKDHEKASFLISKLSKYQQKEAAGSLPSAMRFQAEKLYNAISNGMLPAILLICAGIVAFVRKIRAVIFHQVDARWERVLFNAILGIVFAFLTFLIGLRGYVSGHMPLANGFETMQFLAWSALLLTFVLQTKFELSLPFGLLLSGMAMMVAMMGESNPQITPLMPVLSSPLLSIHVVLIMLAYTLLAFTMLNGLTACILHWSGKNSTQIERLHLISNVLLYPAVFLLAAGIFVGAVWANISWGRYWGWDPKEVWALITLLIYSLALHPRSLPWFNRPMFFHWFTLLAFLSVLVTYFGVNFILGGMHSYAG